MKKNACVFNLFLIGGIVLLLSGCQKNLTDGRIDPSLSGGSKNGSLNPLGALTTDVYVAGGDNGAAVYWKNGVETTLPGGNLATGIAVSGSNVYVCGYGPSPTTGMLVAQEWINGVLTNLSDGSQFVLGTAIAVSGTDVYVTGYGSFTGKAWYWKNGTINTLPDGDPTGIAIDASGNIYISNDVANTVSPAAPNYYLNSVAKPLPYSTVSGYTLGVSTLGSNFYIVGTGTGINLSTALLWNNGSTVTWGTSYTYEEARSVTSRTIGSTAFVYVAGIAGSTENNMHIVYWNNSGDLQDIGSGTYLTDYTGVAVDGSNNVYVCGTQTGGTPAGGVLYTIPNGGSPSGVSMGSNTICAAVCVGQ